MGAKHSIEDDLINFKITSKQMLRSSKKCEKSMAVQKEKLKQAISKGNMEGARIYAQNCIREKNQSLNFLRLSSRIDAVASKVENALRMQQVSQTMGQTVHSMSSVMKTMNVENISSTMADFEKLFEDMDVRSAYMEGAMENSTSMTTPPEEVDTLIQMVADEAGLSVADALQSANSNPTAQVEVKQEHDDLEARLAALRK